MRPVSVPMARLCRVQFLDSFLDIPMNLQLLAQRRDQPTLGPLAYSRPSAAEHSLPSFDLGAPYTAPPRSAGMRSARGHPISGSFLQIREALQKTTLRTKPIPVLPNKLGATIIATSRLRRLAVPPRVRGRTPQTWTRNRPSQGAAQHMGRAPTSECAARRFNQFMPLTRDAPAQLRNCIALDRPIALPLTTVCIRLDHRLHPT